MDVSKETVGVGMTFDLGANVANPFVPFWHMTELCRNEIASFQLGLTRVQQTVRSEWHIPDGGQLLSKTVPFLPAIAHKSETSTATKFELPESDQNS